MNKITEELLKTVLERLDILENSKKPFINKANGKIASQSQVDYIFSMSGKVSPDMSMDEAGDEITRLLKLKNSVQTIKPKVYESENKTWEDYNPEGKSKYKPLTDKQIEEFGEENLL